LTGQSFRKYNGADINVCPIIFLENEEEIMRIVVTGSGGFLGSSVVEALSRKEDWKVYEIRNRNDVNLNDRGDTYRFINLWRPDVVVHLAADVGGIKYNLSYPADLIANNATMTTNIMWSSAKAGVKHVVFAGSVCMYPPSSTGRMRFEYDLFHGRPHESNHAYGHSKLFALAMCEAYRQQYDVNFSFPVFSNMYGPREPTSPMKSHMVGGFMERVWVAKEEGRDSIDVWGSGHATRDLLYVDDAADAVVKCIELEEPVNTSFNVSTGIEISIEYVARLIADEIGFDGQIIFDHSKPEGETSRIYSNNKAEYAIGWRPKINIAEGIKRTCEWYKQHRPNMR